MYGLINRIKRLLDEIESLLYQEAGLIKMLKIRKGKIEFPCNITEITDGYSDLITAVYGLKKSSVIMLYSVLI